MKHDSIKELQAKIVQFRDDRDWKQFHNPKDLAISLLLEASELLEQFQWKNAEEMKEHIVSNGEEVRDELADVVYWILLMAHDLDIHIGEAVHSKLEKNNAKYPVEKAKGNHKKYTELAEAE
jgi:NTP pyrophosphatase (non-canonical NTP hydrolase)